MGKKKVILGVAVASGLLGYAAYKYWWLDWQRHEVLVEVTESVVLPSTCTESFTDLSVPIEGAIRVKCNLLSRCTFRLALAFPPTSSIGRSSVSSFGSTARWPSSSPGRRGQITPSWESVETNTIVDPLVFEQMGQLQFTPALFGDYLIARYKAWPHNEYNCAATVKQCWVQPAGAPNAYKLSLELHIHETVGELVVSVLFPKNMKVVETFTGGVGSWRPYVEGHNLDEESAHPRSRPRGLHSSAEYLWDVGGFAYGETTVTHRRTTGVSEPLDATTGPTTSSPSGDETSAAGLSRQGTDDASPANRRALSPEHQTSIVILPFSVVYTCVGTRSDSSTVSSASDGSFGSGSIQLPSVNLTYCTGSTASAIEVQRLKLIEMSEEGAPTKEITLAGSSGDTITVRRKPLRSACHRTMHSQQIEVISHL